MHLGHLISWTKNIYEARLKLLLQKAILFDLFIGEYCLMPTIIQNIPFLFFFSFFFLFFFFYY